MEDSERELERAYSRETYLMRDVPKHLRDDDLVRPVIRQAAVDDVLCSEMFKRIAIALFDEVVALRAKL